MKYKKSSCLQTKVESPLNYTGGKFKLLPQLLPHFPDNTDVFVDLFCGGASVGLNAQAGNIVLNDIDSHVMGIIEMFRNMQPHDIVKAVEKTVEIYGLSDSATYGYDKYGCNASQGLASYNRPHFTRLRNDFNALNRRDNEYYIKLFTLIIFSFNNQIRFNAKGEFNLPAGKRDFNTRVRNKALRFAERLKDCKISLSNLDFRNFSLDRLTERSFIYADPPYLVACATYNERNAWNENCERELLAYLDEANHRGIRFALSNIISSNEKENVPLMAWLDSNPHYFVNRLDYNYSNANYHKKNRDKTPIEVLITNCKMKQQFKSLFNN